MGELGFRVVQVPTCKPESRASMNSFLEAKSSLQADSKSLAAIRLQASQIRVTLAPFRTLSSEVEHRPFKSMVLGSIPRESSIKIHV